jgi:antitoxin ParD1/3/4
MTIKTTVTLSESTLREAEALVERGEFASLSQLLEEGARQLILQRQDTHDPVAGMADEIRRRMELPRDQWISMKDDDLFDRVRARIKARDNR